MTNNQLDRFLAKVYLAPSGCWEWTGYKQRSGYGHFNLSWRPSRRQMAHRCAYEHFFGEIPNGLVIDHLCRNRSCVNPTHVEAVTQQENCSRGQNCKASGIFFDTRDREQRIRHLALMRSRITREHRANGARKNQVYQLKCQRGHLFTRANSYWRVQTDGSLYRRCKKCHSALVARRKSEQAA